MWDTSPSVGPVRQPKSPSCLNSENRKFTPFFLINIAERARSRSVHLSLT